jgi:hypothetical protein
MWQVACVEAARALKRNLRGGPLFAAPRCAPPEPATHQRVRPCAGVLRARDCGAELAQCGRRIGRRSRHQRA